MTKSDPAIIERKVGEKVKLHLGIDKTATKDLGDGQFEAVVTTSSTDRHNEQIVTSGIDVTNYMASNPVVLYGHDYFGLPIGKTLALSQLKNKMKAKFQLAVEEYDFASTVAKLIAGGYLNAVSIGGVVRKWSEDYRTIEEMEMVEFSIVSIPANSEAIITGRAFEEMAGKSIEQVGKEYEDFSHGNMLDKLKHIDNDEIRTAIEFLEKHVATLKESVSANSSVGNNDPATKRIIKVRMLHAAKAVDAESERVIKLIKLKLPEGENHGRNRNQGQES